jgi:Protein of unknown function (DUF4238)
MQHHIIPQFYLRGFRDTTVDPSYEPSLWVVDLQRNTVRLKSPKNIAKATDYYAISRAEGPPKQDVENRILGGIESNAARIITRLRDGSFQLTDEQRSDLAVFVSTLITRTPAWRENVETSVGDIMAARNRVSARHPEYFARELREACKDRNFSDKEIEDIRRSILDPDAFEYRATPTYSLGMMLKITMRLAPLLFEMGWLFVIAPLGAHFITSDNPVDWCDPTAIPPFDRGLGNKNTVLSFPLGPEVALIAKWKESARPSRYTTDEVVSSINHVIVHSAARYVFAAHREEAEAALAVRRDIQDSGEPVGPRHAQLNILEDESED